MPESLQARVNTIVARHVAVPGALLNVLHEVQGALGLIPDAAIPLIAAGLNLSRAEVHGVVSFYHYFRKSKPGRYVLQICRAEACQSMRGNALAEHVKRRLQVEFHETTKDRLFSLEPVYCLGNCACAPAVMVDKTLYGRVTPERFDEIVAEWRDSS
jgi:formate dehydrogenase subunit gamma